MMARTMDMETFLQKPWYKYHPLARIRARATINGKPVTMRWSAMWGWLVWDAIPEADSRAADWVVTVEEDDWEERWKENNV